MLQEAAELEAGDSVFPISARRGTGIDALLEHLGELMPEGPFMYEADAVTDQPRDVLLAELIREAAVRRTFREVPHAIEVVIEEVEDAARGPHEGASSDLGGERVPEGHPDRRAAGG